MLFVRLVVLMLLVLAPARANDGAASVDARSIDTTPRIAVFSAYEPEWKALEGTVEAPVSHHVHGVNFVTGRVEGRDVVLVLSGISMVNAAMTAQMAVDRFNLKAILFSGVAGGVDPALDIGDVVIAERWGEYLDAALARETPQGFRLPPWLHKEFANFGMIFPQGVSIAREGEVHPVSQFWFPVDAQLLGTARTALAGVTLKRCTAAETCLSHAPKVVVGGNGVSGTMFVDNAAFRAYALDTFKAEVLDMESAAVAHVSAVNGTPFLAFRSLSDLAGGGPGENEIQTFQSLTAENTVTVVRAFLKALPN
jgi:adenosylhomocysteine nucleosidase